MSTCLFVKSDDPRPPIPHDLIEEYLEIVNRCLDSAERKKAGNPIEEDGIDKIKKD